MRRMAADFPSEAPVPHPCAPSAPLSFFFAVSVAYPRLCRSLRPLRLCGESLLLLVTLQCSLFAQAVIVDHTCTDIDRIPDPAIAAAAKVRSVMRHCSILQYLGANNDCGLNLLRAENPRYDRTSMKFLGHGHPGAEAVIDDFLLKDCTSETPGGFVEHTAKLYDVYGTYIYNTEKWNAGLPNWPYYRDAMLACEKKFPDKRFVWCTMSVTARYHPLDEERLKVRDAFNDAVRDFCRKDRHILYDLADLMSHDPAGNPFLVHNHPALVPEYTTPEDLIHVVTPLGKKQLAKAYWWLMARLSGWNPEPVRKK